jgi:hypothetical protein
MSGLGNRLLAAAAKHYQRIINNRVAAYGQCPALLRDFNLQNTRKKRKR